MKTNGRKWTFALALGLSLAGCSTVSTLVGMSVSQQVADEGLRAGALAVTAANEYLGLPRCGKGVTPLKGVCKSSDSIAKVQSARNKLQAGLGVLEKAIEVAQAQGTGVPVASTAYKAVMTARSTVTASLPTN